MELGHDQSGAHSIQPPHAHHSIYDWPCLLTGPSSCDPDQPNLQLSLSDLSSTLSTDDASTLWLTGANSEYGWLFICSWSQKQPFPLVKSETSFRPRDPFDQFPGSIARPLTLIKQPMSMRTSYKPNDFPFWPVMMLQVCMPIDFMMFVLDILVSVNCIGSCGSS